MASQLKVWLLRRPPMHRLFALVSTLMLVLVLWTGTAAHAAEAMNCGEVVSSTAGHFEGDSDEVPSDSGKATPHHHNACHGHCMAVPSGGDTVTLEDQNGSLVTVTLADLSGGSGPATTLRPPIA